MAPREFCRLEGPLSVAYHKEDDMWFATALQFSITGSGETREDALVELKELLLDYFEMVISTAGKVRFQFPSDEEYWNLPDRAEFAVRVVGVCPVRKGCDRPEFVGGVRNKESATPASDQQILEKRNLIDLVNGYERIENFELAEC